MSTIVLPDKIAIIVPNLDATANVYLTTYLRAFPYVRSTVDQLDVSNIKVSFSKVRPIDAFLHFKWQTLVLLGAMLSAGVAVGVRSEKIKNRAKNG